VTAYKILRRIVKHNKALDLCIVNPEPAVWQRGRSVVFDERLTVTRRGLILLTRRGTENWHTHADEMLSWSRHEWVQYVHTHQPGVVVIFELLRGWDSYFPPAENHEKNAMIVLRAIVDHAQHLCERSPRLLEQAQELVLMRDLA